MKKYKIAIIGLGRMGSTIDEEHPSLSPYSIASVSKNSERLDLVAGSDLVADRRNAFKRKWGIEALYEDFNEMIDQESPDMVAVCTRATSLLKPQDRAPSRDFLEDSHSEIGTVVSEAGVPMLYLEKAISNTISGADMLLEACSNNRTVFNSGVLRRFCNWANETRKIIDSGEIGDPQTVVHHGRGSLMHGHVHSMDTISYLLGDPKILKVRGELFPRDLRIKDNRVDADPVADFQIVFENGVEACSVPGGPVETEIKGSKGSIRTINALDTNQQLIQLRSNRNNLGEWKSLDMSSVQPTAPVTECLHNLIDAYESGKPSKANIESSHRVAECLLAVAESHRQGGAWIQLPVANRDLYVFHV